MEEKPGVTRDRKEVEAEWQGAPLHRGRHGRLAAGRPNSLDAKVSQQSEKAIRDADVVLLVVDANVGVAEEDSPRRRGVCDRCGSPVVVVVNKVDDTNREAMVWDFLQLGLGEPSPVERAARTRRRRSARPRSSRSSRGAGRRQR